MQCLIQNLKWLLLINRPLTPWPVDCSRISEDELIKWLLKSHITHKSVNLIFYKGIVNNKCAGLWMKWLQRNHASITHFEIKSGTHPSSDQSGITSFPWCAPRFALFQRAPVRIEDLKKMLWLRSEGWWPHPVLHPSLIGCTSCIIKSFRSRRSFISSPLWTP